METHALPTDKAAAFPQQQQQPPSTGNMRGVTYVYGAAPPGAMVVPPRSGVHPNTAPQQPPMAPAQFSYITPPRGQTSTDGTSVAYFPATASYAPQGTVYSPLVPSIRHAAPFAQPGAATYIAGGMDPNTATTVGYQYAAAPPTGTTYGFVPNQVVNVPGAIVAPQMQVQPTELNMVAGGEVAAAVPVLQLGAVVRLKLSSGDSVSGEVFCVDSVGLKCVVLRTIQPNGLATFVLVKLHSIVDLSLTSVPQNPPSRNLAKCDPAILEKREAAALAAFEERKFTIGVNVSREAQEIFDFIHKTHPRCRWSEEGEILVMDMRVPPPYDRCIGSDVKAANRIQEVLHNFQKRRQNDKQRALKAQMDVPRQGSFNRSLHGSPRHQNPQSRHRSYNGHLRHHHHHHPHNQSEGPHHLKQAGHSSFPSSPSTSAQRRSIAEVSGPVGGNKKQSGGLHRGSVAGSTLGPVPSPPHTASNNSPMVKPASPKDSAPAGSTNKAMGPNSTTSHNNNAAATVSGSHSFSPSMNRRPAAVGTNYCYPTSTVASAAGPNDSAANRAGEGGKGQQGSSGSERTPWTGGHRKDMPPG